MRAVRFLAGLIITTAVTIMFNNGYDAIPPLGKFLDPVHGFWQNAEKPDQPGKQDIKIPGLKQEVTVWFDQRMVPHIKASNEEDLYRVQGYITASMRLWQMDMQRRVASGRLSEIIGERTLETDRFYRRLGIRSAAEQSLALLEKDTLALKLAKSYIDGVNAYIDQLDYAALPIEFKLLNYTPEPFTLLDALYIPKYMAHILTGTVYDIEYTNALGKFGKQLFDLVYPDFPDGIDPVIPTSVNYSDYIKLDSASSTGASLSSILPFQEPDAHPFSGSNNWAVSGKKTFSGHPILCNDPHLRLSLPSVWFEVHLICNDLNVYGVTFPGAPGVVIGFNNHAAWGVTNAGRDVKDYYHITFKDNGRNEYRYHNQWVKAEKRIEKIEIKGGETFYDTIIITKWGPVLYDKNFPGNHTFPNLALKWAAHEPSLDMLTFYYLNRAKSLDDYYHALQYYHCPAQNFVFASTSGDIAITQQGKFPLKPREAGKFIQDANEPTYEWDRFIPFAHNPTVVNPERGFVSSANQHPTDTTYPYYYNGIFEYYRNRRINQELSRMDRIQPEDMMRLQTDNFNLQASESLPYFLENLNLALLSARELTYYDLLDKWSYYNDPEIPAPAIYEAWWDTLKPFLWDEFSPRDGMVYPNNYVTIDFLKNHPDHVFIDNKSTPQRESIMDLLTHTFLAAVDSIERWKQRHNEPLTWANYKNTPLEHIGRIKPFSIDKVQIGGNEHIVNATNETHGASWRMVVELSQPVKAWGVYPGGQSGNPGSKHYDDFVATWAKGGYYPLLFFNNPGEVEADAFLLEWKCVPDDN